MSMYMGHLKAFFQLNHDSRLTIFAITPLKFLGHVGEGTGIPAPSQTLPSLCKILSSWLTSSSSHAAVPRHGKFVYCCFLAHFKA